MGQVAATKEDKMERTFIFIKPDGVERGLIGECIKRIEQKGFKITKAKLFTPTKELVENHYKEHKGKPFFEELVEFVSSNNIMALQVEGFNAISILRLLIGETDPNCAKPGTIRGDYANTKTQNIIHASDSVESAERELELWF